MSAPQSKTVQVIDEINDAILSGRKVDEFTIQRWKRDAEGLRSSGNLFAFYELNGMLSQLQGDVVGTKDWFQKAVVLYPENLLAISNYATALSLCRDYAGALENTKKLYKLGKQVGDIDATNKGLVRSVVFCCRLGRFIEGLELYSRIPADYDMSQYQINVDVISKTVEFMELHGINDDDVAHLIGLAYSIYVSDYTHESSRTGLGSVIDKAEPLLQLQIPVDGDAKFASELNDQLFDKIIESEVRPNLLSLLSCLFVPLKG